MKRLSGLLVAVVMVGLPLQPTQGAIVVGEGPINDFHVGQFTAALGGGPIDKVLIFNEDKDFSGTVDSMDVSAYLQEAPLTLYEQVTIAAGSDPWTDWHEEILTLDWVWGDYSFSAPGLSGLSVSGAGSSTLDFYFDPLPPGTVIDIEKDLQYTGDVLDLFPSFGGAPVPRAVTIGVWEYPTPEPATYSLLAIAGLALALYAYRRRKR